MSSILRCYGLPHNRDKCITPMGRPDKSWPRASCCSGTALYAASKLSLDAGERSQSRLTLLRRTTDDLPHHQNNDNLKTFPFLLKVLTLHIHYTMLHYKLNCGKYPIQNSQNIPGCASSSTKLCLKNWCIFRHIFETQCIYH